MPTGQANRLMPTLRRVVLGRQSAARPDAELLGAFVNERDADAFAELVRRHGAMVLGVCRRVVGDRAAADDAFQAVFLVLARRAASVRPRSQVGNWLYGVAYRTALKARMVLARRRSREKQVEVMPEPTAPSAPTSVEWSDLQTVIDEELARLPDKLRVPVVLCDLEGRPQREVARQLNVPPATLATRLASARRTLAQRLTRRGVTLSGGALAGLLGVHGSASAVPPALAAGAVRAGEAVATGTALDSLVSAHAVQLSEGVMRMMMLAKLKAVALATVTALALCTGLGVGLVPAAAGDNPATGRASTAPARPGVQPASNEKHPTRPKDQPADPKADDATFLRRLTLDLRGDLPTPVELWFFTSDDDEGKRTKVVEWLVSDDAGKVIIAKRLGISPERLKIVRVAGAANGTHALLVTGIEAAGRDAVTLAFTPDGKQLLIGSDGKTVQPRKVTLRLATKGADAVQVLVDPLDPKQAGTDRLIELYWAGEAKDLRADRLWTYLDADEGNAEKVPDRLAKFFVAISDSDAEFLKRVLTDVRGSGPTALELKYFSEDKDPKKREKLLDTLLKDPAVQKKLGDAWKLKMLSCKSEGIWRHSELFVAPRNHLWFTPDGQGLVEWFFVEPTKPQPAKPPAPDKFEKLVAELIAAKKSDAAILESLTLATLGRLPTDGEKKLTLASIASAKDRKTEWVAIAKALAGEPKP